MNEGKWNFKLEEPTEKRHLWTATFRLINPKGKFVPIKYSLTRGQATRDAAIAAATEYALQKVAQKQAEDLQAASAAPTSDDTAA